MQTREQILKYGLSFPDTYLDAPFHDPNWQLVRDRKNKKLSYGPTKGMDGTVPNNEIKRVIDESYDLVTG